MAFSSDDIATLEAAIASGVKTVRFAGPPSREITYQDTAAMVQALAIMRREVNGVATLKKAQFRKGFRDADE